MPRKQRTIIEETLPDKEPTTNANTDIEDLVIVLSKVYRVNNSKRSFSFQSAEPIDEVMIQDRCPNGGSFVVIEFNSTGEQISTQQFEIEPKPNASVPGVTSTSDIQTSILMNELQFMRSMLLNMVNNRTSESTPITEIIRAAKDIHSMGSGKDPIDLLIRGMELGQKSNGGATDFKTELLQTAKEAVLPVVQLLTKPQPQLQQPNGATHMIEQPNNTPSAIVKQAIAWLKGKIIIGLEPGLAVDWILQNGSDPQYQPILSMAVQGTVENFIEQDAELANEPYRTWFTSAIQMIKDAYAEQSGNTNDMVGGNRDVANTTTDAKSGTAKSKLKKVV